MKILRCLSCKGELDVIGDDGIRKIVKCRDCNFTSGNVRRRDPEVLVIKRRE